MKGNHLVRPQVSLYRGVIGVVGVLVSVDLSVVGAGRHAEHFIEDDAKEGVPDRGNDASQIK